MAAKFLRLFSSSSLPLLAMAIGLVASLLLLPGRAATEGTVAVIDFENFDLGGELFLDVGSPLEFTDVDGSGVNVSIVEGADHQIYDLFLLFNDPNATSQALIDWPSPLGSNPAGTTILFDKPVSDFSLRAGDFGGDDDSPLTITAYDTADLVIGSHSVDWTGNPPFATLSVNVGGIRRIVYQSGGSFANSTFIDDLSFTTTNKPTPTTTPTPTISPTPTKQPKPADTDGDGCPDVHENRPKGQANQGGGRDYLDPNDYYDVYGPNSSLTLYGVIDLPNDILGVIQHFAPQGAPPYDVRFDRGVTIGANHWQRAAPDGVIDLPNDILGVILQFGHNCF